MSLEDQGSIAAKAGSTRSAVLTLNAGSSSIKAGLFDLADGERPFLSCLFERIGSDQAACHLFDAGHQPVEGPALPKGAGATHEAALGWLLPVLRDLGHAEILAVGHRVVHSGPHYSAACLATPEVVERLEEMVPAAVSHQPHELNAIRAALALWPGLPQIACFDTAFHSTIPEVGHLMALPQRITAKGVRRYGFHGLSYDWIAGRLPELLGERASGRVVIAHLGNGSSLCGLVDRKSRATTMGFTALDGLVMGDRPGNLDPGVVLYLFDPLGHSVEEVRRMLYFESGLRGVSGLSNDMRTLLASEEPAAKRAVALYIHKAMREIAGIAAEIGGLDAVVFTGGIGEHAAPIRAGIMEGCAWMGLAYDPAANAANATDLSPAGSRVTAHVLPTNEEAVIARQTRAILAEA